MKTEVESPNVAHDRKATELFYEFQWRSMSQTLEVLSKGLAFYFILVTACVGLIFQSKMQGNELITATVFLVTLTLLVIFISGFMVWGLLRALKDVERTLRGYHPQVFQKIGLDRYFGRGKFVAKVAAILCLLALGLLACCLFCILLR